MQALTNTFNSEHLLTSDPNYTDQSVYYALVSNYLLPLQTSYNLVSTY